jgi:hypothetical protein
VNSVCVRFGACVDCRGSIISSRLAGKEGFQGGRSVGKEVFEGIRSVSMSVSILV